MVIRTCFVVTIVFAALVTLAQRYPASVTVTGSVVEPVPTPMTDEVLSGLQMPDGFHFTRFARLNNPRIICVGPNGTVYVSQREPGNVVMLRDTDRDGVADVQRIVFRRKHSHGLAVRGNELFVATATELYRAPILRDGTLGQPVRFVDNLPDGGQHPNRTLAFGRNGKLYVSIGSSCNACTETNPEHATILEMDSDGKNRRIFASGLRNTIGFDWHPSTGRMWGMDHGVDWLGDDAQQEELNELLAETRYGWPYILGDGQRNPQDEPPPAYSMDWWQANSREPVLLYTAHAAPMQMAFYRGAMFPQEFRGSAFVTMRGSWNRSTPSGYEVVRILFDAEGRPTRFEPFLTGFLRQDGQTWRHYGRLCGLAEMPDGSLLVGDDTNNILYRLSYGAQRPASMVDQDRLAIEQFENVRRIDVRVDAFNDGGDIPLMLTEYGRGQSPAMSWGELPSGTQSVVVLMEDADSSSPKPFAHWLIADLSPTRRSVPPALPHTGRPDALRGAVQGSGNAGEMGYYGPKPPAGDPAHRYHFQVFALDRRLNLPPGFNRHNLLRAMRGHVLGAGKTVGTFRRR